MSAECLLDPWLMTLIAIAAKDGGRLHNIFSRHRPYAELHNLFLKQGERSSVIVKHGLLEDIRTALRIQMRVGRRLLASYNLPYCVQIVIYSPAARRGCDILELLSEKDVPMQKWYCYGMVMGRWNVEIRKPDRSITHYEKKDIEQFLKEVMEENKKKLLN